MRKFFEWLLQKETVVNNIYDISEDNDEYVDMCSIKIIKRFGIIINKHTGTEKYNRLPSTKKTKGVGFNNTK